MEKVEGRIDKKDTKKTDQWERTTYEIKGKKYSTFELHEFNEGDVVDGFFVINDKYNNLKTLVLISEENQKPKTESIDLGYLRVKVFESSSLASFESSVNEFNKNNDVKYTQTHVNVAQGSGSYSIVYSAVLFYK